MRVGVELHDAPSWPGCKAYVCVEDDVKSVVEQGRVPDTAQSLEERDGVFHGGLDIPDGGGPVCIKFALCNPPGDGDGAPYAEEGPVHRVAAADGDAPRQLRWGFFDEEALLRTDGYLEPYLPALRRRFLHFKEAKDHVTGFGRKSLDSVATSYTVYGFNRGKGPDGDPGVWFREWAPGAPRVALVGDFNDWNADAHPCERDDFGIHSRFLPDAPDGSSAIPHGSKVKICVTLASGERVHRLPAWLRFCGQEGDVALHGVYWDPPQAERHQWRHGRLGALPQGGDAGESGADASSPLVPAEAGSTIARAPHNTASPAGLRVYEAHVGMASEAPRVGTYREFADQVLPRVKSLGYNCVQLMAVLEHAYYGSFGYHVTNFFAIAHRSGTPEDFKYLVDTAHGLGLRVIIDIVHAHASKNVDDGLNMLDGTDHQYFHGGERGEHKQWDSRLFNYGKVEVLRFLLSNARWFTDEYRVDGFRFDGITSMLYTHHGLGTGFSGHYDEYLSDRAQLDLDAIAYLMLVNEHLHSMNPPALTIAEDVSGMPTLCRPVAEGGVGFDYRLAMALPDLWIKMLKEQRDEEWSMGHLAFELTNRRHREPVVAYAESHDQALVGDKTIAFWLMDKHMYTGMSLDEPANPVVERGMALHKMIRAVTYFGPFAPFSFASHVLGGEAWLNFMGNEFGHPEWIDFPREGNQYSYHYCRRQWSLADDPKLRYAQLNAWDAAMHALEARARWLTAEDTYLSLKHEEDMVVVVEKAALVWVFNFHPQKSFADYRIGAPRAGRYRVVLSSDMACFGGHDRVDPGAEHVSHPEPWHERPCSMQPSPHYFLPFFATSPMLRHQKVGAALAGLFGLWLSLFFALDQGPLHEVVTYAPWLAFIAFGSYSLFHIGHGLSTFGTCPEAAEELTEDVKRARQELRRRKFSDPTGSS